MRIASCHSICVSLIIFTGILKRKKSIDVSLVPNYKNKDEFVLWLAGFIERITEGGVKRLPPIHEEIPAEFTFERDLSIILAKLKTSSAEQIKSYFESDEYKNN